MNSPIVKRIAVAFLLTGLTLPAAFAQGSFSDWLNSFRLHALQQGISEKTLDTALEGLTPDAEVLRLDGNQPEFIRPIWQYLDRATSPRQLREGRRLIRKHRALLDQIEGQYGVPKQIIVAIWGIESDFGANYGNKSVLRSLATLGYQGKRAEFATGELLAALKIIEQNHANTDELIGSWAGAMGQAQFIPSSFLKYAVDYDQDGHYDLWDSLPDVFASIANFLAESGWRRGQTWGFEVVLPAAFDWKLNVPDYEMRNQEWQELGLRLAMAPTKQFPNPHRQSRLFVPAGQNGPIFLIQHNFDVIRRYNKSNSYALAVAQMARQLGGGSPIITSWPRHEEVLSLAEVSEIQQLLNRAGHDSGKVDGKIGQVTKQAIQSWQIRNGLAGDGFANKRLLNELRRKHHQDRRSGSDLESLPNNARAVD